MLELLFYVLFLFILAPAVIYAIAYYVNSIFRNSRRKD